MRTEFSEIISVAIFAGVIVAIYAIEAYLILDFVGSRRRGQGVPKLFWSRRAILVHLFAAAGAVCILYGYFIEPYWIDVKKVEIPTVKLHQTAIRLVQISDLHCSMRPGNEKKLVELVNSVEPDVVVFTGDAVNTPKALPLFKETLKSINARLGKFAVRGNIDIMFLSGKDIFGGTGFQELDGNSIELQKGGEAFYISGLNCVHPVEPDKLLGGIPKDCFSIFLYHYSDLVEDLQHLDVDLYLCGHTHGGQVVLPFYGALVTLSKFGKKYEAGEYAVGSTVLYVNRGIGMAGGFAPKVRFLARPEITIFEIKPK
ncbi:MAG: metallophosphoesterase [Sedimentisphaerales bacterium]